MQLLWMVAASVVCRVAEKYCDSRRRVAVKREGLGMFHHPLARDSVTCFQREKADSSTITL